MKRKMLAILLVACASLGCKAQPQKELFEPVRFEDGTVVDRDEAGLAALLDADPVWTDTIIDRNDTLLIVKHTGAFVRLRLEGLPEGGHIDRIDLVPMYGDIAGAQVLTIDLGQDVPASGEFVRWMAFAPKPLSALAVIVHESASLLSARIAETDLKAGTAYRWDARCLYPSEMDAGMTARPLMQTPMPGIAAGEYSGITHIGGDNYAVVDDNLPGSGILFFRIPIDETGTVGTVSMRPTEGAATGKKRDSEGIAFVPDKGCFYVSSEKHQEIREYDLRGMATGAGLQVPEDLSSKSIASNRGFEALTYHAGTGLFWTTTESPLKRDTFFPRILRLQSFDRDGNPAGRFLYQTGNPSISDSSGAQAYVFGVPALAALDDGRLIVLEREVYVPKGGMLTKLRDSFSRMDLYVVDPAGDPAGILRKAPLCSFRTGALDLANFEGMCLGPTLPDGRRCLVLIADSQNSSGGLIDEYVKVILLR